MMSDALADIGVIGGSGFYELFPDAEPIAFSTPFGAPSEPIRIGDIGGRAVAFLARHGRDHRFPAHRINYRANLWALRAAGVRRILAPCAVGSLRADLPPGTIVVPDQLVDRTSGRCQTFYDDAAVHVSFAEPYCPDLRAAVCQVADEPVRDGGTMVVIEGPRFSTRAESQWYASAGWSVVNMTGHPEAVLARELALCYTPIALVTDFDAGIEGHGSVDQNEVFRIFAEHITEMRALVVRAVTAAPADRTCACECALDGMKLPFSLP